MDPKECEKLIRSVLNSSSADLSISGLVKDFLDLVGVEIPFRQYGFNNLIEYLNSIHWILQVDEDEDTIEDPKECEKLIRSVLNSTSSNLSISGLVEDFLDLVGTEIPFQQYGFNNLIEYLNSIHWILQVDEDEDTIEVIPSKKSKHIFEMIQAENGRANWDEMKKDFSTRCL